MCDVVVFEEKPRQVVAYRAKGSVHNMDEHFGKVAGFVQQKGIMPAGPWIVLYYCENGYDPENLEYEICVPVAQDVDVDGDFQMKSLSGGKVASILHRGAYKNMESTYDKIFAWVKENGYDVKWPTREVYIRCPMMVDDHKGLVTDIQLPLE